MLMIEKHKHSTPQVGSIEWFFHNQEHELNHCEGGPNNPYKIKHMGNKHGINKRYARGHGIKTEPQWFYFTKRVGGQWWDLSSGIKIDVSEVPLTFK